MARQAAEGIGQEPDGMVHIQALAQPAAKTFRGIHRDIVEAIQFQNDHHLDDLVDCSRVGRGSVVFRGIRLVYQVAAEQDVESGQLSNGCPVENRNGRAR